MTKVGATSNANIQFVHVVHFAIGGFGTKGAFFEYDVRRCDAEIIITAAAVTTAVIAAGVQVGKVGKDE